MAVASEFQEANREVKDLQVQLNNAKKRLTTLESRMVDLIADGKLPTSFALGKGNIHLRSEMWASPKGGDHETLTTVLSELGLYEYLPRTVNSQSLSAYIREFRDELGEIVLKSDEHPDGLPVELASVLNIVTTPRVRATGG